MKNLSKLSIVIYKHFQWQHFEKNLKPSLDNCNGNFDEYEKTFTTAFSSHAQKKDKVIRGNHEPHYNKNLWKAIMENPRLKNKANKSKQPIDIACYKIRLNLVVSLNRQSKFDYFNSLPVQRLQNPSGNNANHTSLKSMWLEILR